MSDFYFKAVLFLVLCTFPSLSVKPGKPFETPKQNEFNFILL